MFETMRVPATKYPSYRCDGGTPGARSAGALGLVQLSRDLVALGLSGDEFVPQHLHFQMGPVLVSDVQPEPRLESERLRLTQDAALFPFDSSGRVLGRGRKGNVPPAGFRFRRAKGR